jgi:hypothetical protein
MKIVNKSFLFPAFVSLVLCGCSSEPEKVYPVKELPGMPSGESSVIYNLRRQAEGAAIKDRLNGVYRPDAINHDDIDYGNLDYEEFEELFRKTYIKEYNKL